MIRVFWLALCDTLEYRFQAHLGLHLSSIQGMQLLVQRRRIKLLCWDQWLLDFVQGVGYVGIPNCYVGLLPYVYAMKYFSQKHHSYVKKTYVYMDLFYIRSNRNTLIRLIRESPK